MFNALKYIKNLEDVGFPREQAEAQVQLVIDSFQDNVATKADMGELRSELKTEMAELRTELKTEMGELRSELRTEMAELRTELKTEMADLRADFAVLVSKVASQIAELKTDLVFRLGGIIVVCTGVLGLLIKFK